MTETHFLTSRSESHAIPVHRVVMARAAETPDRIALDAGDRAVSYRRLAAEVHRLAHRLRAVGVGAERPVAIALERSPEVPVAILAVLEAGGVALSLPPELPTGRLAAITADARPAVVITGRRHRAHLEAALGTAAPRFLELDAEADAVAALPATPPAVAVEPDRLAYLLHTSGSTGTPKGVAVGHRAIRHQVDWLRERFPSGDDDRHLYKTPFAFTVALSEILWALGARATLVIARPGGHGDPAYLAELVARRRVTTVHFVPSLLRAFLDHPASHRCRRVLRRVLSSGEALTGKVARAFFERLGGVELHNLYGATEAPRVCLGRVTAADADTPTVPLGRPAPGARIHLLDRRGHPVAAGETGEIVVGGPGLGRGYPSRPGDTAAAFVPDPFVVGDPGARLYRTGDLGRLLPDGRLAFAGRRDHQLQLRGTRVEPGEVEVALGSHPRVAACAVAAPTDADGEPRLVAYVVLRGRDATGVVGELRRHLAGALPEQMVPERFVTVDALPLTPSGKVDRQALSAPGTERPEVGAGYTPPRTPGERTLAAIWAEVLELDRVGVDDDFFELGGHSLLATRVISRARDAFGVELPLRAFFDDPTVAAQARRLAATATEPGRGEDTPPPLEPVPRQPGEPLLLSPAQRRLWFLDRLAPGNPFYNVPAAWRIRGRLDPAALDAAVAWLIRRHESLRTTFGEADGRPVQRIAPFRRRPLPAVDLRALPPERARREAGALAAAEAARPFDLEQGPVARFTLLRIAGGESAFLATLHHVVSDGWSVGVLRSDLAAAYRAAVEPGAVAPPPLPVQYADYAAHQRRWLRSGALERQLAHWRRQLAGAPIFELPTDRPRPAVQSFRGRRVDFELPASLTGELEELGRRRGATLFMTLLAAFDVLLFRLSGRSDVTVGSPIANRRRPELEGLIGFFVNTLVLRSRLGRREPFDALLARVRETALGAYGNQDLPFERLVEELRPERELSRNPLFQVAFALQNAPRPEVDLGGATLHALPFEVRTTRFDLELHLWRHPGGLSGVLYHDRDLFDRTTMVRLHRHFRLLLEAIAAGPGRRLAELPLLSPAEEHQLLREWNDTATHLAAGRLAHRMVAEHARRRGELAAVVAGELHLSYGELDDRARKLARRLQTHGVGPESVVALHLGRGPELVIAQLAVLHAGGAFLPVDPGYPERRRRFLLDDARPEVVIAREGTAPELTGGRWTVVDPLAPGAPESLEEPSPTRSGHLAYLIYTSGSTGTPKGVAIEHRGLANLVSWYRRFFEIRPGERMTQVASPGFDAAVFEVWNCLAAGGTLHLVDDDPRSRPETLPGWLAERRIGISWLPTPLAEAALAERWPATAALRNLQTAGDRLHRSAVGHLPAPLYNLYGPTEATVLTSWSRLSPTTVADDPREPPIGRPMGNFRVHLLDAAMNPVPIGAVGELYLGGTGVARGYRHRPALTAERFVPDPAGTGDRLYRTGDLGRHRADGEIDFLGRVDDQVKVRGWRIELGEVESLLARHPAVRQAAVIARPTPEGTRLQAFVVAKATETNPEAETEVVDRWKTLYETTYAEPAAEDFTGWNSSYTGNPIPAEEMQEWAAATVARLRRRLDDLPGDTPPKVLEIGCGTGLLLRPLAPACAAYVGTDFSAAALDRLRRRLAEEGLPQVTLRRAPAHDLGDLGEPRFDAVVINSVAQYFPSVDYLLKVIEGAASRLAPGGFLFLGDLRSLPLHRAYALSVELHRAPADLDLRSLAARVSRRMAAEEELLLDPALFPALRQRLPGLGTVEVLPRRGRHHNELTRFRYDAVLHRAGEVPGTPGEVPGTAVEPPAEVPGTAVERHDWEGAGLDLSTLRRRLEAAPEEPLAVAGIPNARLAAEAAALRWLADPTHPEAPATVGEARRRLARTEPEGVDPETLYRWAEELPCRVELGWQRHGADGRYDARFLPVSGALTPDPSPRGRGAPPPTQISPLSPGERGAGGVRASGRRPRVSHRPWPSYANDPLAGRAAARLVPALRRHLGDRLPEPMVPAAFTVLPELPLTPHGKVDRAALAALPDPGGASAAIHRPPRSPAERTLARSWSELLGVDRVGLDDDFFALGGHSLLATQVVSRVRRELGVELPLQSFFRVATLEALAATIDAGSRAGDDLPDDRRPPIHPVARPPAGEPGLPLSFAQQRLWFLDRLVPDNPFYLVPVSWTLEGQLAVPALAAALAGVVRRHEVLRTRFVEDRSGDGPSQVVDPPSAPQLAVVDLRRLDPAARRREVARWSHAEARRPFDLARDLLLRTTLLRLEDRRAALLLTTHHVAADGWSLWVLVRDLGAFYRAAVSGRPPMLPPLPIQYADFAVWQRRWLTGAVLERQLELHRRRLAGAEPLELPTDRPRPAVQSFRGGTVGYTLESSLVADLGALGQERGATLFMVFLAAYATLLHRLTHRDDLVIGSPIANRNLVEIEELVGFFVNSLALRCRPEGGLPFTDFLDRVRETAVAAYAHQDLPFERLVEELHPERELSRNPIFQVTLALQNAPRPTTRLGDVTLYARPVITRTTRFDVEGHLRQTPEGRVEGHFHFDRELFDATTLERWVRHFRTLLHAVAADPRRRLGELPLLGPAERAQLAVEAPDHAAYPAAPTLPELFARHAAATPDAVAVTLPPEASDGVTAERLPAHLGYGELHRRVCRLAGELRRLGTGPEGVVALLFDRSVELVTGLLAVLEAGGAYLPLDPTAPENRLADLLADAGAHLLLTAGDAASAVPGGVGLENVDGRFRIGTVGEAAPPSRSATPPRHPDHLAYVIYTSGSTGRPKGTSITHRNVTRLFDGARELMGHFTAGDAWTLFHSYAFDFSVWELLGALLHGGRLVVVPRWLARSPGEFLHLLAAERVTVLNQTPSAFRALDAADRERPAPLALRLLVFGGEKLDPSELRGWVARRGDRRPVPVNMYGITETTVHVTHRPLTAADAAGAGRSPIGTPLPDLGALLLDRRGAPVPLGVAGELFVAGDGLARGYLGRPGLTAERFLPHPHAVRPGARIYRTGDLARRRPGGELDFLGRVDRQVKIRGYRIEPGEVAAAVAEHPGVREAVVLAREVAGDPRLVAYVVPGSLPESGGDDRGAGETGEQVARWRMVFDDLYGGEDGGEDGSGRTADPTFDVVGWESRITGEAIPAEEMAAWLDDAVGKILELRPRRVLEIGCGTGMILFRVAPEVERYLGSDLSPAALDHVGRHLGLLGDAAERVELVEGDGAAVLDQVTPGSFDLLVLNSVVQYLPSPDHLVTVIEKAASKLAPGGRIFLGDLRSLPLLDAFHAAVAVARAGDDEPLPRLRQVARRGVLLEEELVLDPAFFTLLRRRLPRIRRVEVRPQEGRFHNELSRFRYAAVLHLEGALDEEGGTPDSAPAGWLDWADVGDLASLRRRLAAGDPGVVAVASIPNARLTREVAARRRLDDAGGEPASAGELRRWLRRLPAAGVDPEALREVASELGYRLRLGWGRHGADGRFDAIFHRPGVAPPPLPEPVPEPGVGLPGAANDPRRGRTARRLVPELRSHLAARLPEYMMPASYLLVDSLPLTVNGKLDRRALPRPEEAEVASAGGSYTAPRTAAEATLAEIWAGALGVEGVGVEDDFFDLGGHSLLAAQVVAQVRRALGVELPLRALFEVRTVARVAALLGDAGRPPLPPLRRRRDDGGEPPLSFAQQRLWFLDRLTPGNPFYVSPVAWRICGRLDLDRLEAALRAIVRRHEVLRTVYPVRGGEPRQRIVDDPGLELRRIDLRRLDAGRRRGELHRRITAEVTRPFDLAAGPVLRAAVFLAGDAEAVLLLVCHHVAWDGWSLGVVRRELRELYRAAVAGRRPELPALPVQYADYAVWQRRWLTGERLEAAVGYWRRRLAGAPELELPTDRPRPAVRRFRGRGLRFRLGGELAAGLEEAARSRGGTLFMALLAGFSALLGRHAGAREVVVGSPVAGRDEPELEPLIGFFVNTLALRVDLPAGATFGDLLGVARETAVGAFAHQELPFEKLVEELEPGRDLARNPFFQVLMALQISSAPEERMAGLVLEPHPFEVRTARFDLELSLERRPGGIAALLVYDADLFDPTTVRRLAGHLRSLLAGGVADPGRRLGELPLLTAPERQQLIERGDVARPFPAGETLDRLLAARVAARPEAVALVEGDRHLSYGELRRRAGRLAAALRRLGCGPEVPVGVCAGGWTGMITATVAVVDAGGVYVPLDPSYPSARLSYMVRDSGMGLVVVEPSLASLLPEDVGGRLAVVEGLWLLGSLFDSRSRGGGYGWLHRTRSRVDGDRSVYLMYTSGSTGDPKGVAVTHRGVARLVLGADYLPIRGDDRVAQISNPSFDAATFEIWGALLAGATLVAIPKEVVISPPRLAAAVARGRPSILHLTTALCHRMAEEAPEALRRLRALLFGGEAAESRRLRGLAGPGMPTLLHFYGPTESTTFATCQRLPARAGGGASPPIGRAIANTTVRVLDDRLRPVPGGVPGELFLGGAGLARGYHRRPGLTAERFVPDPDGTGERLYRTGDRVRALWSGELQFLGRFDHQVKVRGFRVEPGEVEAALGGHPAVSAAVVLARRSGDGVVLTACAATRGEVTGTELRAHLAGRLPAHMLPASVVVVDELPLTANGKVDRRALAALVESRGERATPGDGAAPRTPAGRTPEEEIVASVFAELLDRRRVSADDDFFALGGHSLLAARAVEGVRRASGVELPLRTLFEDPTVAGLARRIAEARSRPLPPIQPLPPGAEAPLSPAQERLWFLDRLTPGSSVYNVPVFQRLRGPLDEAALAAALTAVVRRHAVLRARFPERGGVPRQVVVAPAPVPLPRVDLTGAGERREAEARRIATAELARPFDLAAGPLHRATLLRLAGDHRVLLLTFHHTVADGASMAVLRREVELFYRAHLDGTPASPPPLPVRYPDFAAWQRRWLAGPVMDDLLDHWRGVLAGAPPLDLPADRPRPPVQRHRGRVVRLTLGAELAGGVAAAGRRVGATPFMAHLAAFAALLHRRSGARDVVVGTPIAGRVRPELEPLIGFFVNTLPLRLRPRPETRFADLLEEARRTALAAYAHQEMPFERLVRELEPERDLARNPVCQVMLSLHDGRGLVWRLPGVAAEAFPARLRTANFDLNLSLVERADGSIEGSLRHDADLFDATTAHRFGRELQTLLAAVVADPETPVGELAVLTREERHQLLREWNPPVPPPLPPVLTLPRLLELQARLRPSAVALVCEGEELSYRRLHRRARELTRRLAAAGVAPEEPVAVVAERTAASLVAIHGVLAAGAAYLPLDPATPELRRLRILEEAGARFLLTPDRLEVVTTAPPPRESPSPRPSPPRERGRPLPPEPAPGNLAYVIFTSGSTGRPKGVAVEHRQVVAYLAGLLDRLGVGEEGGDGASFASVSTLATDLGHTAVFGALATGGTLHLVAEERAADPEALAEYMSEHSVDVLKIVPSHLEALLAGRRPGAVLPRRALVLGGEAAGWGLVERVRTLAPGCRVLDHYGPTEATVGATAGWLRSRRGGDPERPPIGRPLAHARVAVADRALRPTPIGVPGELLVGGDGIARGYLRRPAATAERFIPDPRCGDPRCGDPRCGDPRCGDPRSATPGGRLYRTGDLARLLADGRIDFLGRVDHQLEIRGFRVEPGEIAAALEEHPAISRAVVVAAGAGAGTGANVAERLVAYFVRSDPAAEETAQLGEELRRHLLARLPRPLVPHRLVELPRLPLTAAGKVDRGALPAPEVIGEPGGEGRHPETETERTLAGLWRELLGVGELAAGDDFFARGGHSLLATQLVSRMRRTFDLDLPLRTVFETPTLERLAEEVDNLRWAAPGDPDAAPESEAREEILL